MDSVRIVGLGGSLSEGSSSLRALRLALDEAAAAGAQTELLDLRELALPMYDENVDDPPHTVRRLTEAVRGAHGMIWSSPLYHGTISGAFKNGLDWLQCLARDERPYLTDKVVGLIAAAGGTQGLQAINTMEFAVRALRGWTVPLVVPITQSWRAFGNDGKTDGAVAAQLAILGREVVRAAGFFATARPTSDEAAAQEGEN